MIANCRAAYGDAFVAIEWAADLARRHRRQDSLVDLVIVAPWDRAGTAVAPVVAVIASRGWPPVVAYVDGSPASLHELARLYAVGVTDVVVQGEDDAPARLRALRHDGAVATVRAAVLRHAQRVVPYGALPLLNSCLAATGGPPSAASLARALGTSTRTVTRLAQRAGFSGIRQLTARCRLVLAIGLILRTRQTTEQVALWLGYDSGSALYNLMRRHAHVTPAELAVQGDLRYWIKRLIAPKA